jgi:uncharacterized protein YjeT (DUF2065 family)
MDKLIPGLYYVVFYTLGGGIPLLIFPQKALSLLGATGNYANAMARLVGMFLIGLGVMVLQIIRKRAENFYKTTLFVRSFFCLCLLGIYVESEDPMFLILFGIVFVGVFYFLVQLKRSS